MDTPIADFVRRYADAAPARFHMPGHKGAGSLGCEALDITEVQGADALYEAEGIIARSEANAAALFGTAATFYSTEGSSLCIRAMLTLALLHAGPRTGRPVVIAARNAHKTFLLAASVLDLEVRWLWSEAEDFALCRCPVSPAQLERQLVSLPEPPVAVYVTSPDYLGGELDIAALAETAHRHGVPLLVDNAHGAYLHFLPQSRHPMDLGADLCCDSAHKTLPVLTGGAYLHVSRTAPADFRENAKQALALFGSTSPSYLILQSLDLCNRALSGDWPTALEVCTERVNACKARLRCRGWTVEDSDPLKLTVNAAAGGWTGAALADHLRRYGVECEYADPDFLVLMITPGNLEADFSRLESAFAAVSPGKPLQRPRLHLTPPEVRCSPRQAAFAPRETVPAAEAQGRVLAAATVACPPAVPVVVSGEVIGPDAPEIFRYYGIREVSVMKE